MLTIRLPEREFYDPVRNEFTDMEERVLRLEHSLLSVSKWEARHKKAFLSTEKTDAEMRDYVRCMSEEDVDERTLARLTAEDWRRIGEYLNDPMSATTFGKTTETPKRKKTTSEEFYWMMAQYGIPFDCEKWHFNRLAALLRICAIRGGGQKKMSRTDALKRQAALNAARRKKSGSKG